MNRQKGKNEHYDTSKKCEPNDNNNEQIIHSMYTTLTGHVFLSFITTISKDSASNKATKIQKKKLISNDSKKQK